MKIQFLILFIIASYNLFAQIDSNAIRQHISILANDSMKGREFGTSYIKKSSDYIATYYKKLNLNPYFETYEHFFESNDVKGNNVLAYIEGEDKKLKNELIIISAHYDHIGMRKPNVDNDSVMNGANDNAAGTAIVLELANYFSKEKKLKRSILFVNFTGEEKGLLGSIALAAEFKKRNIIPYCNINLEMMGTVLTDAPGKAYMTGFDKSNLAELMNAAVDEPFVVFSEIENKEGLFYRSDNFSFYDAFNIPAHTLCTFDFTNFDYYHDIDDEPQHLNYSNMSVVANRLASAIKSLANTKTNEVKLK
jgi:Zn-dependent M28 family amino/carboxypeptidase